MGSKNVFEFVTQIQYDFFAWLKQNEESFPFCCAVSSEVLGGYLKSLNTDTKVCLGTRKNSKRWINYHAWVAVGSSIIDFTSFQYDRRCGRRRYRELGPEEAYKECILRLQNGTVVLPTAEYYQKFKFKLEIPSRFTRLARGKTFEDYLDAVLTSTEFKEFRFNDNVPEDQVFWLPV